MNWLILSAGVFSAFTVIGHFTMGVKENLKPMLAAEFDEIPKQVMHSAFHFVSVYLIMATLALLGAGFGYLTDASATLLVRFVALNYAFFAVWQIFIAATSDIERGVFKLFQWVFFVIIASLAWWGTL